MDLITHNLFPSQLFLAMIGFFVGTLGTLVGAGGGFILVPILIFMFPDETADRITAISMAVVFFNAASGTFAYARMKRIDFDSGWKFVVAAIPGALLGAFSTAYISRHFFDLVLGGSLLIIAILLLKRDLTRTKSPNNVNETLTKEFKLDAKGQRQGSLLSAVVGFVSSSLGIGGGIIHVPAMVYILRYPIHRATATSHFVLACTSFVAVLEHLYHRSYAGNVDKTLILAIGAFLGAQLGAKLSTRLNGITIVRGLAMALLFVSIRIIWQSMGLG